MKIMSLNGWGGKLHEALSAYLEMASPDVLCLQEVVHSPVAGKPWLDYRDGDHVLPQRAHMFAEVAAVLPDHTALFCPAAQGVLWDGDQPLPSQWGLATFVRKSLPIVAQAQGFVHKTFSPHGYGEHPRSRNAHAIRIYDFEKQRFVTVAHMHGLRDLNGKMDTPERRRQAMALRELATRVAAPDDPLIVGGDFNVEPSSETFALLAEIGCKDLVTAHGFSGTRTSFYRKPGRFADYLLVNDRVEVLRFDVVTEPEVSDHCPLLLEI
jgi:endonuclease/exonuclease/phosphatase family metal-dependent hydrolase